MRPRRTACLLAGAALSGLLLPAPAGAHLRSGARDGAWSVPILLDGRRTVIAGLTRRLPAHARWPWLALLAAYAAVAVALGLTAPPGALARDGPLLGAVAGTAATLTAAGFSLDSYASAGTWIASFDEAVFIAAVAVALVWARHLGRRGGRRRAGRALARAGRGGRRPGGSLRGDPSVVRRARVGSSCDGAPGRDF